MVSSHSTPFTVSVRFQIISTLFVWFLLFSQINAQNRSGEVDILLKFEEEMKQVYLMAGQAGSLEADNAEGYWSTWKETDDNPCTWMGVTCSNTTSTVVRLDLSNWGLQCVVKSWESLSGLQDLRELDLSFNDFQGSFDIPFNIEALTKLTSLDLSSSAFYGTMPLNISACPNLQYISLQHNQLSGDIPNLGGLVNLQVLLLADNYLTGGFPLELEQITSLVSLDMSQNMLNGTIPSLSNLANLLHLKLDNNNFADFEGPNFPGAMSLEHLSVSRNQLEGFIPPGITALPNLKVLHMSSNRLSGDIPRDFYFQQPNITRPYSFSLDLSHNQLTGPIPGGLPQLADYMSMNLSHNLLVGGIPFDEAKMYRYDVLDLSNNHLSGPIPSFFNNHNNYINSLCLQNNEFFGDLVDLFPANGRNTAMTTTELRMGNNYFTGDLSRFADINNNIWPFFQVVDLSNNNLQMSTTSTAADPLSALLKFFMGGTHLKELYVGGNNFSGTSLPTFISPNYTRPSDFFSSTFSPSLTVLDLSNNHLKGNISSALFNFTWLPSLEFLNLSNNDATGPIPESIFNLPYLQVLDLANNKLSGPLPYIPPDGRLYDPNFYANNDDLCGDPLRPCRRGWWVRLIAFMKFHWVWLVVAGSMIIALGSCLATAWRWKACRDRTQQDADLIRTLLERESTTLMSLRELRKATDNFAERARIGEGGFGIVYKGKLSDGTIVAIKKCKHEGAEKNKRQFLNEVKILSQVNHRNLVKLLGCCMENKIALLVFEFISNGTLQQHLQRNIGEGRLTWNQRVRVAIQTADALHYLHSAATFTIYHQDVKSGNILLDGDLNAKVSDLGISRLAPLQSTHITTMAVQGTFGYIDPEYYTSLKLTDKSDVYSFGVVLLELMSAKPTLDSHRGSDETSLVIFALRHIKSGDLQQLLDPALMETYNDPSGNGRESIMNMGRLAMKCLNMRSKARPSMSEVWKELQNLWVEHNGTSELLSEHLGSTNADPQHHHIVYFSEPSFGNCLDDARGNQMLQCSHLTRRLRSRSY